MQILIDHKLLQQAYIALRESGHTQLALELGKVHNDNRKYSDVNGAPLQEGTVYYMSADGLMPHTGGPEVTDPLAHMAEQYPAYWKPIPANWQAIDTYRVGLLFPLRDDRLIHARKKLLVPGVRTGGKSLFKDVKEAHATLEQYLLDHQEG